MLKKNVKKMHNNPVPRINVLFYLKAKPLLSIVLMDYDIIVRTLSMHSTISLWRHDYTQLIL